MTAPGTGEPGATLHLGRDVVLRLRLPGPPRRRRPARIGSLASASQRFAAALSQPVHIRGGLRGPRVVPAPPLRGATTRPPRWWRPVTRIEPVRARRWLNAGVSVSIPRRGLPRAARRVPNDAAHPPGVILDNLVSTAAPVRRHPETAAAGPMTTSHDVARLTPPARPAPSPARPRADARATPRRDSQPRATSSTAPAADAADVAAADETPLDPPAAPPGAPDTPESPPSHTTADAPAEPTPEPARPPAPLPVPARAAAPPSWLPARTSRLAATRPAERGALVLAGHRGQASPTRARTSVATLRLGSFAAVSLIARRPSFARRGASALRRPPGRVAIPRLRVSAARPRLPLLPSVSRVVNADLAKSKPFRALRAAVRSERQVRPARVTTWERAAVTGATSSAITLAATRGLAAATPPRPAAAAVAPPADPAGAPAEEVAAPQPPVRPHALAGTPTAPFQLGAHRRLDSAIRAERIISPATPGSPARPRANAISLAPSRRAVPDRSRAIGSTRRELAASAVRAQAVAMTGLLATRDSLRSKAAEKPSLLASAFGPGTEIRPAAAQATEPTHATVTAGKPPPSRIGAHRGAAAEPVAEPPAEQIAAPPTPRRPVSRLGAALGRASALAAKSKESVARAGTTLRGHAREARDTAVEVRRLLPAPPRVSLNVSTSRPTPKPAIPAAAAVQPSRLVPGPDGKLRPSLIDTTAALFAAKFGAERAAMISADLPGTGMGAQHMTTSHVSPLHVEPAVAAKSVLDDPRALRELTDKVVDRIEARVIDELERRGRRHSSGSF
jgi:hypothetical protein